MTLPDWLARAAPSKLGAYLGTAASPRKSGLFVRHLCRQYADAFPDPRSLAALDAADQFADGEIDAAALGAAVGAAAEAAAEAVAEAHDATARRHIQEDAVSLFTDPAALSQVVAVQRVATAAALANEVAARGYFAHAMNQLRRVAGWSNSRHSAPRKDSAQVLRVVFFEHFGDTERPVALDPTWLTDAVVALAAGVYADRAFERLPVLADALEDAGCANADVLAHCRGPGPHARGCWVVDLLLGKA